MKGLIQSKFVNYKNSLGYSLEVRKYARKVFYDNLWHTDKQLMKSRGSVFIDNQQVVWPMDKCFNYGENGTGLDMKNNCRVELYRKVNGFMINLTRLTPDVYIVSTTGSACLVKLNGNGLGEHHYFSLIPDDDGVVKNNKFLMYAIQLLNGKNYNDTSCDGYEFYECINSLGRPYTLTMEGCHEEDVHIVEEEFGLYPLSYQIDDYGEFKQKQFYYKSHKFPNLFVSFCTKEIALEKVKEVDHEGFMVCDWTGKVLFKLKSPYYLAKKWVQRDFKNRIWNDNYRKIVEEEYFPIIHYIRENFTKEVWKELDENQKSDVFLQAYKATIGEMKL